MKNSLLILLVALTSFMPQKKQKVIFFGDSITQQGARAGGYITRIDSMSRLANRGDQFEFIGAGIGGNKVYDLYLRLENDVLNKNPDVVFIYVGVNDVWHKRTSGTGVDPEKFEKFYQAIIDKLKARSIRVVLVTPAAIGEKTDYTNEQDGDLNRYCALIRNIAKKNELAIIDLREKFLAYNLKNNPDNKERGILTTDGVHLNAAGNQFVADAMWELIKK